MGARQSQLILSLPGLRVTATSQMHLSAAGQAKRLEAISSLQRVREGEAGVPTELDVEMKTKTLADM